MDGVHIQQIAILEGEIAKVLILVVMDGVHIHLIAAGYNDGTVS